jgi:glucosylceramidase
MNFVRIKYLNLILSLMVFGGCTIETSYNIVSTDKIIVTSESGDKLAEKENIDFIKGNASGNVIQIFPDSLKQTMDGIGTSFTESSAFVLAHLDIKKRKEVMENIFGEKGADFTLTRTHIGSCDFTVKGKYSYADKKDDKTLSSFNITPDLEGFSRKEFPGIKDEKYDLLPMIREALEIKNGRELRIISSAWTAPNWMKDIEEWFIPGSPANNWQGTGGSLKPEYVPVFADYLVKYLDAYKAEGIEIWGLTPVNEPHGNNGQWESMKFTPESQSEFVKKYLGPKLREGGHGDKKLLIYDQNRDGIEQWTDVLFADKETSQYVYGVAIHWYESTEKVYEDVLERVKKKFPDMAIINTEACIDDLGKDAPSGVKDPEMFKEKNWFDNDSFWWNRNATDWAYTVPWEGVKVEDHTAYTPVHRYARNIIVSIDNWLQGWTDWNIVLNKKGGPNHVNNHCGAPIMIDTETQLVYYTPVYHVLSQFSRTIRPGDRAVFASKNIPEKQVADSLFSCATINDEDMLSIQVLNTAKKNADFKLQIGDQYVDVKMIPNSLKTVRIKLNKKGS